MQGMKNCQGPFGRWRRSPVTSRSFTISMPRLNPQPRPPIPYEGGELFEAYPLNLPVPPFEPDGHVEPVQWARHVHHAGMTELHKVVEGKSCSFGLIHAHTREVKASLGAHDYERHARAFLDRASEPRSAGQR